MITTDEICDKKFSETDGGYDKKEVDDFLDHICDEIDNQNIPHKHIAPTIHETFLEVIGVLFILIGLIPAITTARSLGKFDFVMFAEAYVIWLFCGCVCIGISFVLEALREIANRIR